MKKQNFSTFNQSDLGRAKPKKHGFQSVINSKLKMKRHHSDTGLVEDRSNSTMIVRTIMGLLLVHIVIIGGVLLRGHFVKSQGVAMAPSITPPPAENVAPAPALPQPVQMNAVPRPAAPVAAPAASSAAAPAALPAALPAVVTQSGAHITQASAEDEAEEPAPMDPNPAASAAAAAPAKAPAPARTVNAVHLVQSGDTWGRIAAQYGTSVEALKAANPKSAAKSSLIAGVRLQVPVNADSELGRSLAATQAKEAAVAAANAPKIHVVKRGESLGLIARKYKLSLKKLMQLNNLSDKDARRLAPGRELKVSE